MRARLAAAVVALAASGCDPVWTLDVRVVVPEGARVQAGTDPEHYLFVRLTESDGHGATYVAGSFCDEPPAAEVTVPWEHRGIGRAGPRHYELVAWVEREPPEVPLACPAAEEYVDALTRRTPPPGAWIGAGVAFEWGRGSYDAVTLVLAPPGEAP